jgi:2-polyprenyl-3-methyl-5-hydroxy-6-metoxy-1,4-benzoquinol methylase
MADATYVGQELTLFKDAVNWKHYWFSSVSRYVRGSVLEVGAGIGINTNLILANSPAIHQILALEPDKQLASQILSQVHKHQSKVAVKAAYLSELDENQKFDTILYIDVIEHIEKDAEELMLAKKYLAKGGHLIVLVPAYNYLFSPFDKAIGHHRRYNKKMLLQAAPQGLKLVSLYYLDSLGVLMSFVNKLLLKQRYPTRSQILFWDRLIIPTSRLVDQVVFRSFGKSLIGIWKNE